MYKIITSYFEYGNNKMKIDRNSERHKQEYIGDDLNRLWSRIEIDMSNHRCDLYTPIMIDKVLEE